MSVSSTDTETVQDKNSRSSQNRFRLSLSLVKKESASWIRILKNPDNRPLLVYSSTLVSVLWVLFDLAPVLWLISNNEIDIRPVTLHFANQIMEVAKVVFFTLLILPWFAILIFRAAGDQELCDFVWSRIERSSVNYGLIVTVCSLATGFQSIDLQGGASSSTAILMMMSVSLSSTALAFSNIAICQWRTSAPTFYKKLVKRWKTILAEIASRRAKTVEET
jgi:hypothetical protein